MNAVSKNRLRSLFFGNRSRVGNGQISSAGLGLVDRRPKSSSDKARLNVLRAEDIRRVGARPSTKRDDKAGKGGNDEVGIGEDDKAGTGRQDDKLGIGRQDGKPGIGGRDGNKVGNSGQNDRVRKGGQSDDGAEPITMAFHIGAQRLLRHAFLLAARSDTFFTFSSSDSVIC